MGGKFNRKDFLEALFFKYCRDVGGFIAVRTSDQHNVKSSTRYFPRIEALAREPFTDDQNVLFGVCPREKMKPGKEHIRHVTAVWACLDIGPDGYAGKERHFASDKQALVAIRSFPVQPSIVVLSGRGLHLYWLLKEITEVSDPQVMENLLRRLADFFQCPAEVSLDSWLRLPETWNPKHMGHPVECRVQHLDSSLRYDLAELEQVDLRIIIPSKRPPKVPQPQPIVMQSRVTVLPDSDKPAVPVLREAGVPNSPSDVVNSIVETLEERHRIPEYIGEPWAETDSVGIGPNMEKLVDKFIDSFSDRLLDRLADRIVEKLLERLPAVSANR